jgi:hypothetical protein
MSLTKIVVDAHIEIDLNLPYLSKRDMEYYAKCLESEAKDVKEFLRDHRSMDVHDVYVVREYGYKCEYCHTINTESESKNPECCEKAMREWGTPAQLVEWGYEEA